MRRTKPLATAVFCAGVTLMVWTACGLVSAGTRAAPSGAKITQDAVLGAGLPLSAPSGAKMVGAVGEITGSRSWGAPDDYLYHGVPGPKLGKAVGSPTASFSASPMQGAAPLSVQFTDESQDNGHAITAWGWDFGDGTPHSTDKNPVHEYASIGTYTVKLTVTNEMGSDTYAWNACVTVQAQQAPATSLPGIVVLTAMIVALTIGFSMRYGQNAVRHGEGKSMKQRILTSIRTRGCNPLSLLIFGAALAFSSAALAGPATFMYQGFLSDANNAPATGPHQMAFSIWDAAVGGNSLWSESQPAVIVQNGAFSVELGAGTSLGTIFDAGLPRWLEISADTGAGVETFAPRVPIAATPYALRANKAGDSDTVDGKHASDITGAGWGLNGNAATNPDSNYIGTKDNNALTFRVNQAQALRLEPNPGGPNAIGGDASNVVSVGNNAATIAEGRNNAANGGGATVGGGTANQASGGAATVSGGESNTAAAANTVVSGGIGNNAVQESSTVSGGESNNAGGERSTVGGGNNNLASDVFATVGGGSTNVAYAPSSTVSGGLNNNAQLDYSTVAGGWANQASAKFGTISGGGPADLANVWTTNNNVKDDYGTVGGGGGNAAGAGDGTGTYATVGGGKGNTASGQYSVVAGGNANTATGWGAVAGGVNNSASGTAFVGAGVYNAANANHATVAGGSHNTASGNGGATIGGSHNTASGNGGATIGGGYNNTASGYAATVAGGEQNTASGDDSAVAAGKENVASGLSATVAAGESNIASGWCSFAAGFRAHSNHDGSVVFNCYNGPDRPADWSWGEDAPYEFVAFAPGGVSLQTGWGGGACLAPGSSSWTVCSDRNAKDSFQDADPSNVLEKVAVLPISTWRYKGQDPSIRHIGPMAQDMYSAFGLGESDKGIDTVDADGVALAAIQGLNQKLESRVAKQAAEIQSMKTKMAELESMMKQFAAGK